ncbi:arginine biosynthesis bifunctional protein ARG7 [Pisolithus marmoratus]|nr:arginine biosynthesis bifunctional protein ARG7 [Pisolithus marmoratus]
MNISKGPIRLFQRFSSTTTFTAKTTPSKEHLHAQIPKDHLPKGYLLAAAAACFTLNAFRAAPVLVSRHVLDKSNGRARAVVVNSGCANAVTGKKGIEDAWSMDPTTTTETLVMSTGVIGVNLPITAIVNAIHTQSDPSLPTYALASTPTAWDGAARAFMTTDTFPKLRARTFQINGSTYRMAGMDEGAGMVHPRMAGSESVPTSLHATLLGLVVTDAPVSPRSLQSALSYAVDRNFSSISVDGDMSINDTIIALENGAGVPTERSSKVEEIDEGTDPDAYHVFRDELTSFAIDLAKLVVKDGEGATKFVEVSVENAASYTDAHCIASTISTSALVKTALYSEDANWGRILSSTGSATLKTPLDTSSVSVSFVPSSATSSPSTNSSPLPVLINGEPAGIDETWGSEILGQDEFGIVVDLGSQGGGGTEGAKYWTCVFSYEYVRINGDYRS